METVSCLLLCATNWLLLTSVSISPASICNTSFNVMLEILKKRQQCAPPVTEFNDMAVVKYIFDYLERLISCLSIHEVEVPQGKKRVAFLLCLAYLQVIAFVSVSITQHTSQSQSRSAILRCVQFPTAPCCSVCIYDFLFLPIKLLPNSSSGPLHRFDLIWLIIFTENGVDKFILKSISPVALFKQCAR